MADKEFSQFLAAQTVALQELAKQIAESRIDNDKFLKLQTNVEQRSMDLLANLLTEYIHDSQSKFTFSTWYDRNEDVFLVDAKNLDEPAKVRLLLRKLDVNSHSQYVNFIKPKKSSENSFLDTVKILKRMFGELETLFSIRYNCMKLVKKSSDDFISFASTVNRECERFDFANFTFDQFKCLIFVCGLHSSDKEFRSRLLMKIDTTPAMNLDTLTAECKRLTDLKLDAELITKNPSSLPALQVKQIDNRNKPKPLKSFEKPKAQPTAKPKLPYRPCWLCGDKYFVRNVHICSIYGETAIKRDTKKDFVKARSRKSQIRTREIHHDKPKESSLFRNWILQPNESSSLSTLPDSRYDFKWTRHLTSQLYRFTTTRNWDVHQQFCAPNEHNGIRMYNCIQ